MTSWRTRTGGTVGRLEAGRENIEFRNQSTWLFIIHVPAVPLTMTSNNNAARFLVEQSALSRKHEASNKTNSRNNNTMLI
jgi:hypothetical protein